jgi:hypothetical protein
MDIKQLEDEPTRIYIMRFLESARGVKNFDDRIALLAIKKGLRKGPLLTTPVHRGTSQT